MEDDLAVGSILESASLLWEKGDFEGAIEVLKAAYQRSPSNVDIAFEYGHLLGMLSSGQQSDLKSKWRSESLEVLSKLCENLVGLDPIEQWKIRRHYYLYSGQHLQNRSLGYEEIKRGNQLGILSVGFGCLHYAIDQVAANNWEEACRYAAEGKAAFEKLLVIDPPKYGRFLAYALTLALLGKKQEAIDATGRAAKLLGVDQNQLHDHNEEISRLLKFAEQGS